MSHRPDADTIDELLRPTFADRAPATDPALRPWRLGSQGYVAFFGGLLAVTTIALGNARRLGMGARSLALIALAGVAGLGVELALLIAAVDPGDTTGVRLVMRAVALAAWGAMYLVQRRADRRHHFHRADDDDAYESLVVPGLVASILLGLIEFGVARAVAGA